MSFSVNSLKCCGCGEELKLENAWMLDGCPCNSPAGCNDQNQRRWVLLSELQQWQSRELHALREAHTLKVDAYRVLYTAVKKHHDQKADDRCWMDDDELYAAAGLEPVDRCVGDQVQMLENCKRFISTRCSGGKWKSYHQLEVELQREKEKAEKFRETGTLVLQLKEMLLAAHPYVVAYASEAEEEALEEIDDDDLDDEPRDFSFVRQSRELAKRMRDLFIQENR